MHGKPDSPGYSSHTKPYLFVLFFFLVTEMASINGHMALYVKYYFSFYKMKFDGKCGFSASWMQGKNNGKTLTTR